MGSSLAAEVLLFNRVVTAQEALTSGFVSRVLPTENFHDNVNKLIEDTIKDTSQRSMEVAKRLMRPQSEIDKLKEVNRIETEELAKAW